MVTTSCAIGLSSWSDLDPTGLFGPSSSNGVIQWVMTGDEVSVAGVAQFWHFKRAALLGTGTAGPEATPARWVRRRRWVTLDHGACSGIAADLWNRRE